MASMKAPTELAQLEEMNKKFLEDNKNSIHHVHEYIKISSKIFKDKTQDSAGMEKIANEAFLNDASKEKKVKLCERMHKRLVTAFKAGDALKTECGKEFIYSSYFEGKNHLAK
jgi:hypothetical protein